MLVECYYRGRTVGEAAALLNIPAGTVKSRVHYALRALRLALEEMGVGRRLPPPLRRRRLRPGRPRPGRARRLRGPPRRVRHVPGGAGGGRGTARPALPRRAPARGLTPEPPPTSSSGRCTACVAGAGSRCSPRPPPSCSPWRRAWGWRPGRGRSRRRPLRPTRSSRARRGRSRCPPSRARVVRPGRLTARPWGTQVALTCLYRGAPHRRLRRTPRGPPTCSWSTGPTGASNRSPAGARRRAGREGGGLDRPAHRPRLGSRGPDDVGHRRHAVLGGRERDRGGGGSTPARGLGPGGRCPQAAPAQLGQRALAHPVGLLEVRVAGEHELGDARGRGTRRSGRRPRVAPDERRARPPRTRPTPAQRLGETSRSAAVRSRRNAGSDPLLADDSLPEAGLHLLDRPAGCRAAVPRPGPGGVGGVPGDHVQPDAEPDARGPVRRRGRGSTRPSPRPLGRLAPGQVDVDVLRGHVACRGEEPPK